MSTYGEREKLLHTCPCTVDALIRHATKLLNRSTPYEYLIEVTSSMLYITTYTPSYRTLCVSLD